MENIDIERIKPHPKNPRRELRGLVELEASIREKGILQNLTVVKNYNGECGAWDGTYTVIIGHRRLAAAKEAGLKYVPCAVVEMDEKDQIATMMAENVQRNDLQPHEEAGGYQTMLDIGMSVKEISKKTGVSDRTVQRRLKLCELDEKALAAASGKHITFEELDKISAIKDAGTRNSLLAAFGYPDYNWKYEKAIAAQKRLEQEEKWRIALTARGATELSSPFGTKHMNVHQEQLVGSTVELILKKMLDGIQYFFAFNVGWCYLLAEKATLDIPAKTEEERAKEEEEKRRKEEIEASYEYLNEAAKIAFRLRTRFIISISEQTCKDHVNDIIAFLTAGLWKSKCSVAGSWNVEKITWYAGGADGSKEEQAEKICTYHTYIHPHKTLFWNACAIFGDNEYRNYHDSDAAYEKDYGLDEFYAFLEKLGYQISREERDMMNGTHERFINYDEE